ANPKSRKRFDRDRWVKTVTDAERGFAEELTRFFDRQRQDIASRVEKLVTIRNADPELITFEIYNPTQWQAELEKVILGQGMKLLVRGAVDEKSMIPRKADEELTPEMIAELERYLSEVRQQRWMQDLNQQTRDQVFDSVQESTNAGEGLNEL